MSCVKWRGILGEYTILLYAFHFDKSREEDEWLIYQVTGALTEQSVDIFIEHQPTIMSQESTIALFALPRPPVVQVYSRRWELTLEKLVPSSIHHFSLSHFLPTPPLFYLSRSPNSFIMFLIFTSTLPKTSLFHTFEQFQLLSKPVSWASHHIVVTLPSNHVFIKILARNHMFSNLKGVLYFFVFLHPTW